MIPRIAPTIPLTNINDTLMGSSGKDTISYFLHNLDLLKYSYYQFYTRLSVLAIELKSWNAWFHVELGARVTGAKVARDTTSRIIHKFIPEVNLRLDLRPDYIIGGDINLGITYLGRGHLGNNDPRNISDPAFLYANTWAFPHEINLYAFAGRSSKGGLFFRYSGWLAYNKNLSSLIKTDGALVNHALLQGQISKTSYFPQILLGYSTNLSTLIKRGTKPD